MAPKRSAPAPPPPVESSDDTASYESSSEDEEIAQSPPSASTPRNMAPPPQKVQQPEASEEEDEEEEEEEEEATQNPPPPQPNGVEVGSDEEAEEEGTDEEAPPPESSPKHKAKKSTGAFKRAWTKEDEVRILEVLAAYRREHHALPQTEEIEAALAGNLDNSEHSRKELEGKMKSLRILYSRNVRKTNPPASDTDRRILELSREIWGVIGGGGGGSSANGPANRAAAALGDFDEICGRFPYLAEEMRELERKEPGLFKREMRLIDPDKARVLDQKIKKQRVMQMKLQLRLQDVTKEVTKALMDLLD